MILKRFKLITVIFKNNKKNYKIWCQGVNLNGENKKSYFFDLNNVKI